MYICNKCKKEFEKPKTIVGSGDYYITCPYCSTEDYTKKKEKLKEGAKYDEDKLRTDLIPPECIEALAWVYTFGAKKYDDNNWRKGIKFSRVYGAILRHLLAWYKGEDNDHETGKSHTWHAIWGCVALAYYMMYYKVYAKFDDRFIKGKQNENS